MTKVLLITSSPRGEASLSKKVADELVSQIVGAEVTTRDLMRAPLPHIGPSFIGAMFTPEDARTTEQRRELALSDELIAELKAADVVIIAAGMINFGIPSTLKAWIDHVTRSGITFAYGANGPKGLVEGKKVVLVLATGGIYSSGPMVAHNHVEPHLRTSLGFIGLTDIETVVIEGGIRGPESVEKALTDARVTVASVAPGLSAVAA